MVSFCNAKTVAVCQFFDNAREDAWRPPEHRIIRYGIGRDRRNLRGGDGAVSPIVGVSARGFLQEATPPDAA
jgi:hypothetical protein